MAASTRVTAERDNARNVPRLVTAADTRRGVDLLELVGKQYATDPNFALQWVPRSDPEGNDVAKFEGTGWERVKEGGIDVEVMGMVLLRKDRRIVDAELQAVADKGQQNWDDAVKRFGAQGGTVKTSWVRGPGK